MFSLYLVIGALAGVLSGLFGIGGGIIVIPALAAIFAQNPLIPAINTMQMAVGTSLATVVVTSLVTVYAHHQRKSVIWSQVKIMLPGLAFGAVVGAMIANLLPSSYLRIFFGIFLIAVGARMFFDHLVAVPVAGLTKRTIQISSAVIGIISSVLGVGGGTILVPFLLRCQLDILQATGTSVACGIIISMVASVSFMATGLIAGLHLPWSTGYIYWPAFLGIVAASFLFAPVGATLAYKLPKELLKRIFGVFLWIIAFDMLFFAR